MVCLDRAIPDDHSLLHDRGPYQVLPGLVLWAPEEEVCNLHVHVCGETSVNKDLYTTYRYKRTKVGGLTDLVSFMNLAGSKLVGIKSFHHLRFTHTHTRGLSSPSSSRILRRLNTNS